MEKIKLNKKIKIIVKGTPATEQKNPNKKNILQNKNEYSNLKNDKERLDYLAKKLGVL